jgi:hypothetical protein
LNEALQRTRPAATICGNIEGHSRRAGPPSLVRIAKLGPGATIRVEVVGKLRRAYASEPKIGDFLP